MRVRLLTVVILCSPMASVYAAQVAFPVSVPMECVQLAQREHVPTSIENRYQAAKAKYKLARLSRADPLVAQCKDAVERLVAQAKS
jgi:hypothetical protein